MWTFWSYLILCYVIVCVYSHTYIHTHVIMFLVFQITVATYMQTRIHCLNLWSHSDINECDRRSDECEHTCENGPGGYRCRCNAGYTLADDRHSCVKSRLMCFNWNKTYYFSHIICLVLFLCNLHWELVLDVCIPPHHHHRVPCQI